MKRKFQQPKSDATKAIDQSAKREAQAQKAVNVARLTKDQQKAIADQAAARIAAAYQSVADAQSADGQCMLALYTLFAAGLRLAPVVKTAMASLGDTASKDVLKVRTARLTAVAKAVDDKATITDEKGNVISVSALLARRNKQGALVPGSLQGVYRKLNPAKPETQQQKRDKITEYILTVMKRPESDGGGLWVISHEHTAYLRGEYQKAKAEVTAAIDAGKAAAAALAEPVLRTARASA